MCHHVACKELINTFLPHFVLRYICRHSKILWFGHTVLLTYNAKTFDTNAFELCIYIHTKDAYLLDAEQLDCTLIDTNASLTIPMPLFSASVLNLLLLAVRFMYQAWVLERVSVCLPYKNCSYMRMSSLPQLGVLYELSDRSVSRPSPPCNDRGTALPGSFW